MITKTQFAVGDKVYYTGDMANVSGFGAVVKINPANQWGPESYDIQLEDGGHLWTGIYGLSFKSGPGRRFWALEEWDEDQARKINAMRDAQLARISLDLDDAPMLDRIAERVNSPSDARCLRDVAQAIRNHFDK